MLVLVENKLTGTQLPTECVCVAATKRSSRRPGNPDPDRCNRPAEVVKDHANQCHQAAWGRRYWEHLAPFVDKEALAEVGSSLSMQ